MYVCTRCGWGHYHPLSYCQMCPGRLRRRIVPHPILKTEAERIADLASQGITYTQEYPPISKQRQAELSIARANEQIAMNHKMIAVTSDASVIAGLHRSNAFWARCIEDYKASLNG